MAIDLSDYAEVLRREITPLGTDAFRDVTEETLTLTLADGFWEAVLDNLIKGYTCDPDGIVESTSGAGEFPRQLVALVVLYASVKILRNKVLNTASSFSAKAGPVEYQQQFSSQMLTEMLKQLNATKEAIKNPEDDNITIASYFDALSVRQSNPYSYYGASYASSGGY